MTRRNHPPRVSGAGAGVYRLLFEQAGEAMLLLDRDWQILEANRRALELYGYSRAELTGRRALDLRTPAARPAFQEDIKAADRQTAFSFETIHQRRDGAPLPVEISGCSFEYGGVFYRQAIIRDLSKPKQAELALRESESLFRKAQAIARLGHFRFFPQTGVVDGSDELFKIFGLTREESQFGDFVNSLHPDDRDFVTGTIRNAIEQHHGYDIEHRLLLRDGTEKYVKAIGEPVPDATGATACLIGTVHDITELRRTHDALRTSEAKWRSYLENAPVGVLVADHTGNHLESNRTAEELLGYGPGELVHTHCTDLPAAEDAAAAARHFTNVVEHGFSDGVFRLRRKDGRTIWASVRATRIGDGHFLAIFQDITAQQLTNGALQESLQEKEQLLRDMRESQAEITSILQTALDGFYILDIKGNFQEVNDAYCLLTGYTREELLHMNIERLEADESPAEIAFIIEQILQRTGMRLDRRHRCKDGRLVILELNVTYLPHHGGRLFCFARDITGRRSAEEALSRSEQKFRRFFENQPAYCYIVSPAGLILDANQAAAEAMRCTREELTGRPVMELYAPESRPRALQLLQEWQKSGILRDQELTIINRHGQRRIVLLDVDAVRDETGRILHSVSIQRDITMRKLAEEERDISFRLLQEINSADALHELLRETTALLQAWSGCTAVGIRLRDGADYPYFETRGFPASFVQAENRLCSYSPDGKPFLDGNGNPLLECMCGNILSKRFEPTLPFFTAYGSFWTNSTTRLLASTGEAERKARTRNRCNGEGYESVALVPMRDGASTIGLLQFNDHQPDRFTPERIEILERLAGTLAVAISQRYARLEQIESEKKFRIIANYTVDWESWIGRDGQLLWVNPAIERWTGYTPAECKGMSDYPLPLASPEDQPAVAAMLRDAQDGKRGDNLEIRFLCKDGSSRWGAASWQPVQEETGQSSGMRLSIRDITELKRSEESKLELERRLQHSQRLESLGVLAGGVAHDFNNILGAMLGFAEMAREDLMEAKPAQRAIDNLDQVLQAGRRASMLVQQILAFSRQARQSPQPLDVAPVVKEAMKLMRASIPSTIQIKVECETGTGNIMADPVQIHQIIMNLCTNAYHAMRERGGLLHVRVDRADLLEKGPGRASGEWLRLTVRDNGCGMEESVLARIFDPFFTTKKPGEGTGLGLSMVHGMVTADGGKIHVESEPEAGTTFLIYWPVLPEAARPAGGIQPEKSVPHGKGRLMFVDDEEILIKIFHERLTKLGYSVEVFPKSPAALRRFLESPSSFDLLLTDQTMPDLTGLELASAVHRQMPGLPVILLTGFSETLTDNKLRQAGVDKVLMKPVNLGELAETIRELLKGEPETK